MQAQLVPDGCSFVVLEAGDIFEVSDEVVRKDVDQEASSTQLYLRVERHGSFLGWAFGECWTRWCPWPPLSLGVDLIF